MSVHTPSRSFSICSVKTAVHPLRCLLRWEGRDFQLWGLSGDPEPFQKQEVVAGAPTHPHSIPQLNSSGHTQHQEALENICTHTRSLHSPHTLPCPHTHSHAYTRSHTHTYTHVLPCPHTHSHAYTHSRTHTYTHTPMYSHILTCLHTLTYSHLHTHTPMYSHTLIYTHAHFPSSPSP